MTRSTLPLPDRDWADDPTDTQIEHLRRLYPTEPEVDRTLTRKMNRRALGPYRRMDLDEFVRCVESFLSTRVDGPFRVSDARWFTGGVSKIQMGFTLHRKKSDTWTSERMVVRMDPAEGSNATSRLREFELVDAVRDTIPVPRPYFIDIDGEFFPEPALIYSYVSGITKPSATVTGKISGLGTNFGVDAREPLAEQFLSYLAALHTFDLSAATFTSLAQPRVGTDDAARWLLNQARRTWEEDRATDLPLMDVAEQWMRHHLPVLDHVGIVHGDYRSGNFLYDESTLEITAWLDWERGHLGDRHRDLAWTTQSTFGHFDELDRYLVCGLIPEGDFYRRYEQATGLPVDPDKITFYKILNAYQIVVSTLASAHRVAKLGKSHQDVVLCRVKGMAAVAADELNTLLSEVL
ncbi:phosphotransferase family protein [Rhodococcus koreensis]|uniref:phosphotransferase family protein n=1 Tax=Rhodococcus sp. T2V TaxID=3034164 RepID=UPI0023E2EF14|nr:phosphotransferase family protein [Rhodococcus sp. T2V]MDF3306019.1 phosphotransferase family protein [Rhodococcus sp. T2V]